MKCTADARLTRDGHASAHHLHQRRGDGEPQAGAAEPAGRRPVGLPEGFEDRPLLVLGDADARIGDREVEHRAAVVAHVFADRHEHVTRLGELDGVADQIGDDLRQTDRVADDAGRRVRRDVAQELQALGVRAHAERLERVADGVGERKRHRFELQLPRLDLREVEDVVQNRQQRLGGRLDGVEAVGLIWCQLGVECQRRHADDAVHRRPDLVAHVRQELALRLRGVLCRLLGLRQLELRGRPLGAVADDRREPDRPAVGVAIERHGLLE